MNTFTIMSYLRAVRAPHVLGSTPRAILFALATFADASGSSCYPSDAQLAAAAGVVERTVRKWRPVFEWVGFVELERHRLGYNYRLRVPAYLFSCERNEDPVTPERGASHDRNVVQVSNPDRNEDPVRPERNSGETGTRFHQPAQEPAQEPTQSGKPSRDAQAPAREAPAAGLPDDDVGEGLRLARSLSEHMEVTYLETHPPTSIAPKLDALLATGWTPESIREEVLARLPEVRDRLNRPFAALRLLLGDMSEPEYRDRSAWRQPRAPEQNMRRGPTPPPEGCEALPPKPRGWTWYDWAGMNGVTLDHTRYRYV